MSSLNLEKISDVLADFEDELGEDLRQKLLRKFAKVLAESSEAAGEAGENQGQRTKKQFVCIVADPNGDLPDEDMTGWVVQIPENENPGVALERISRAGHLFNTTKRGRKNPVQSIPDAIETVSSKLMSQQGVVPKTKLPVTFLKTDNKLMACPADLE